jgi:hypothetical protein
VEALEALRQIAAASPTPLVINEVNVEGDPVLHQRLLTEIPAVEYQEQLLSHATSRMRIATFIANVDDAVQHV